MATLDDLPHMLDENPAVREDLISGLVSFCARHGVEVTPAELVGRNITDDTVNGYILSLPPGQARPGLEDLPRLLAEDPAVREDLISTLVGFCERHSIEATPAELVGLTEVGDDVSGYGLYPGVFLGTLQPQYMRVAFPQVQSQPTVTIQIQIL